METERDQYMTVAHIPCWPNPAEPGVSEHPSPRHTIPLVGQSRRSPHVGANSAQEGHMELHTYLTYPGRRRRHTTTPDALQGPPSTVTPGVLTEPSGPYPV